MCNIECCWKKMELSLNSFLFKFNKFENSILTLYYYFFALLYKIVYFPGSLFKWYFLDKQWIKQIHKKKDLNSAVL